MMLRSVFLATVSFIALAAFEASAGIGAVGSPHNNLPASPKNQEAQNAETPAAPAAASEEKPLLEIAFDQARVNYERAVSQGVQAAEQAKPGVVYDIISYTAVTETTEPSTTSRLNEEAKANVLGVVRQIRALGVPDSRLRITIMPYPKTTDGSVVPDFNKVLIFVK